MRLPVIYVAGPYRAATERQVELNIRAAEALALEVWQAGAVALCPHMNTRLFGGTCPDEVWLEGDLELLRRCDGVVVTANWQESSGARTEVAAAKERGLPVFESVDAAREWIEGLKCRSERCPYCGHRRHSIGACLNMESDGECYCEHDSRIAETEDASK